MASLEWYADIQATSVEKNRKATACEFIETMDTRGIKYAHYIAREFKLLSLAVYETGVKE